LLLFCSESVFCLLSKKFKIKIRKTIILAVLCGFETWSLILREEHGLRVSENRVLGGIFGLKRGRKWRGVGENCIMRSFVTSTLHQMDG
jgi:hypothetical protein